MNYEALRTCGRYNPLTTLVPKQFCYGKKMHYYIKKTRGSLLFNVLGGHVSSYSIYLRQVLQIFDQVSLRDQKD